MKPFAIIMVLLVVLVGSNSLFVVNEREFAILFQFGATKRSDFQPGIHFKLPFIQNVVKFDKRLLTADTEPQRYLTSEKKDVLVDFYVKWRIADVAKFYATTQGDETRATQRLSPIVRQAVGKAINERTLQEVVGARANVIDQVVKGANEASSDLGIAIADVRIVRVDLPDEISISVFNRMRASRLQVANDLRATGQESAETIRADADRQRQVLMAEALRDSAKIRGDGDAQAAAIYAKAFEGDAEFYSFYRSLEAYRESFRNKDGVLVLDPNSEFFRYFGEGRGQ
jgi:membrane protease subunit HflC